MNESFVDLTIHELHENANILDANNEIFDVTIRRSASDVPINWKPQQPIDRISMVHSDTISFGGYSAVTHKSTPESNKGREKHQQHLVDESDDENSVTTTIHEDIGLPLTAKRVLIRLGENYVEQQNEMCSTAYSRNSPHRMFVNDDYQEIDKNIENTDSNTLLGSNTPLTVEHEQSRSMSLIHKLRQSAFRRKMNSNSTTSIFSAEQRSPSESLKYQSTSSLIDDAHGLSPTSVRDNTTISPHIKSILKFTNNQDVNNTVSPRTLVVGRLENGSLNLRSPLLEANTLTNRTNTHSTFPEEYVVDNQLQDSLIISDSSLDGDFDYQPEMITASSIVSDTFSSKNSSRVDNKSPTTKELGASSMAFIQQIRGAAFRRKMNVTRSRDSFVAKERIHREQIAASKIQREEIEMRKKEEIEKMQQDEKVKKLSSYVQRSNHDAPAFKARPLPKSTGINGNGGLVGVPKIEKRPPTVPISPYLGHRRILQSTTIHNTNSEEHSTHKDKNAVLSTAEFKALPLPKSSSVLGGAGQSGVPKVPKRKVTLPQSPALGLRRHRQNLQDDTNTLKVTNSGRDAIITNHDSKENQDPIKIFSPVMNAALRITPYVPYSTRRAVKRAEFEQRRIINEQLRMELERKEKQKLVKRLQHDLERLRIEI